RGRRLRRPVCPLRNLGRFLRPNQERHSAAPERATRYDRGVPPTFPRALGRVKPTLPAPFVDTPGPSPDARSAPSMERKRPAGERPPAGTEPSGKAEPGLVSGDILFLIEQRYDPATSRVEAEYSFIQGGKV